LKIGASKHLSKMDVSDRIPLISKVEGKTYYLCSGICKMAFEKEPHRYIGETDEPLAKLYSGN